MTQAQILSAFEGLPLGRLSMRDKLDQIHGLLKTVYEMKHQSVSEDTLNIETSQIEDKLSHNYSAMTMAEVRLAVDAGVTGEYKEVGTTPNSANVQSWINIYAHSAERSDAMKVYQSRKAASDARDRETAERADISRRTAEYYRNEPAVAYATYRTEGREGFTFAQYVATIYDALRDKLSEWLKAQADRKERLASYDDKARRTMLHKCGKSIFESIGGVNAASYKDYYKQEVVFDYFDALIRGGQAI